jgi:hypothetical protein
MSYGTRKTKVEGGSGGKRGHSNMNHWVTTEEIKVASRKARRAEARVLEGEGKLEAKTECDRVTS